jgi:hypothetical protein
MMNTRNNARSQSRRSDEPVDLPRENNVFTRPKRSEEGTEGESVAVYRESRISRDDRNWDLNNLDVRYAAEGNETDVHFGQRNPESEEANAEDDHNNFKALADIRESRV